MCGSSRTFRRSCRCPSLSLRSTHRSKSSFMPAWSSQSHYTAGWSHIVTLCSLFSMSSSDLPWLLISLLCNCRISGLVNHKLCLLYSSTEIDDMLRKSTNLLLTRTLSSCLQNLIKKPHIGLTEVGTTRWLLLMTHTHHPDQKICLLVWNSNSFSVASADHH